MSLNRRGHNLLEVVISSTIFAGCVLMFLGVWVSYNKAQNVSRSRLAATSLARSVLEQKIAAGFYACEPGTLPEGGYPPETISSTSQIRGRTIDYELTYQFYSEDTSPAPPAPPDSYRRLTVRVVWKDHGGGVKQLVYATHLYRTN